MVIVALDRIFVPFAGEETPGSPAFRHEARPGRAALTWSQLHGHRRVVLLAEAASGKTTEFRTQAEALRSQGKAAFFLDLATLAERGPTACLNSEERRRIDTWRQSAEDGWFFLDAADELRLTRRTLEAALNRLAHDLGDGLRRAHVFLSSRITDWRGEEDLATVKRCLPAPAPEAEEPADGPSSEALVAPSDGADAGAADSAQAEPFVVTLKPLDRERMGRLAQAHGVDEIEAFLDAIARRGLEPLAERPGDLVLLAVHWKKAHRSLGRPAQMMEALVAEKMRERNERLRREDGLDPQHARAAVERIAAAMTLGQTLTIATPAAGPAASDDALDPLAILPELNDVQRDALLRLGVFAPATFGRIRFHHRMTQEYLAACWLRRILDAGGCEAVEDLLFTSPYGIAVVQPNWRAAAAWLALWNEDVRRTITDRDPRLLVEGGDPSSLPIEARRDVLRVFADRLARGDTHDAWIDNRMLALFADDTLAADIRDLWSRNPSGDVRSFLLRLVQLGRVCACADLAAEVLQGQLSDADLRLAALRAAEACGNGEALRSVAKAVLSDPTRIPARHVEHYLSVLVPDHLPAVHVPVLLRHAAEGSELALDLAVAALADRLARLTLQDRVDLLAGAVSLLQELVREEEPQRRPLFRLASHLGALLAPVLADFGDAAPDPALLDALALFEAHGDPTDLPRLRAQVEARPALKRALFWHDVAAARRRRPGGTIDRPFTVWPGSGQLWHLAWTDHSWLEDDVRTRPTLDRSLALTALVDAARAAGVLDAERQRLRALARDAGLEAELDRLLEPPQGAGRPRGRCRLRPPLAACGHPRSCPEGGGGAAAPAGRRHSRREGASRADLKRRRSPPPCAA
jgi:hypothetical protein